MKSDFQERGSPKNSSDALGWFRLFICLGALVGSLGVLADGAPKASSEKALKVMSYKIHHGEGTDRRLDLERIAAVIADSGTDIVALQELDQSTLRTGGVAQTEVLAHPAASHSRPVLSPGPGASHCVGDLVCAGLGSSGVTPGGCASLSHEL